MTILLCIIKNEEIISDFNIFLQPEDRAQFEVLKAQSYAVREAKRQGKQKRIRVFTKDDDTPKREYMDTYAGVPLPDLKEFDWIRIDEHNLM